MQLAIFGASGHGKVVAETAELVGWTRLVFFDDAWPNLPGRFPWKVEGTMGDLLHRGTDFDGVVVAIGDNNVRSEKQRQLSAAGLKLVSVFHPRACISASAVIGAGSVVFANGVINACAEMGMGCIVNTGAVVEHDCRVDSFSHISPNAVLAGGAVVGAGSWIGACASVKQKISIGAAATIGMGAVVINDVAANTTVGGNPAKVIAS